MRLQCSKELGYNRRHAKNLLDSWGDCWWRDESEEDEEEDGEDEEEEEVEEDKESSGLQIQPPAQGKSNHQNRLHQLEQ